MLRLAPTTKQHGRALPAHCVMDYVMCASDDHALRHCEMVRRHRDGCIHPSSRCGDGRKRDSQSDGPNRTLQRRSRTPTQSPLPLPKQGEGIRRGQHRLVVPVEHEYARCCGVLSMCMASRRLELPFSPFLFLAPRRKRAIFPTAQHSQRRSNAQSNPVIRGRKAAKGQIRPGIEPMLLENWAPRRRRAELHCFHHHRRRRHPQPASPTRQHHHQHPRPPPPSSYLRHHHHQSVPPFPLWTLVSHLGRHHVRNR